MAFNDRPLLPRKLSLLVFIIQCILPGWGAIACGVALRDCDYILTGLCQFFTFFLIVGWVWSIWWGYQTWKKSKQFMPF